MDDLNSAISESFFSIKAALEELLLLNSALKDAKSASSPAFSLFKTSNSETFLFVSSASCELLCFKASIDDFNSAISESFFSRRSTLDELLLSKSFLIEERSSLS